MEEVELEQGNDDVIEVKGKVESKQGNKIKPD